jgi:hypothetical protein
MNDDADRLENYFQTRAGSLDVAPGDPDRVTVRSAQRRHRRIAGVATMATVVIIALVAYAATGGSSTDTVTDTAGAPTSSAGASANAPGLHWTTVDVPSGLAWSSSSTLAADGAIYALSTAPGSATKDDDAGRRTLYRSTDGRAWEPRSTPADLHVSSLASSGTQLYAVGTAPAGGSFDVVVATSTDGASTWSAAHLPMPHADLLARFPQDVTASPPLVAAGPGGVIAAVSVTASPDVSRLAAKQGIALGDQWQVTPTGVDVFEASGAVDGCGARGTVPPAAPSTVPPSSVAAPPGTASSAPGTALAAKGCKERSTKIAASYTWDQLGLEPELKGLLRAESHLYRSADGVSFVETGLGISVGSITAVFGTPSGYRVLVNEESTNTLHQVRSSDGQTWQSSGPDLSGWIQTKGLLGGQPAAIASANAGPVLLRADVNGTWTSADLTASLGIAADAKSSGVDAVAIGPLGVVGVISVGGDPNQKFQSRVFTSPDGRSFTVQPLDALVAGGEWSVAGISMNADAVVIRLEAATADKEPTPGPKPQHLLVGTAA